MLLALAGSTGLAGQANAQLAPGRSGMSTTDRLDNVQAYRDLRAFGVCYARTQRTDALALIGTTPDSREEMDTIRRRVSGERSTCLFGGTNMRMSNVYMRGTIAEGLLRSGGVPETYRLPAPSPGAARTLHEAARCYTKGHGVTVQALLETQPGSREETAAVGALWNDFRPCIAGFRVRLNAPWIRYLLAEALLRLDPSAPRP
ncbi:MAG TPA: hypothetical protein VLK25_00985 [Allosphingosinicella sp.]|nr:hypothetical protein [Allosphingosinicella sp.]